MRGKREMRQKRSDGDSKRDNAPRAVARRWLGYDRAEYDRTGNPVFAWDAIATCLSGGIPFPGWVKTYLADSAQAISDLSRRNVPTKGSVARAVATALRFSGRRGAVNPFTAIKRASHELMVAYAVYEQHTANWWNQRSGREGTHDWDAVFRDAAKAHYATCDMCKRQISKATVRRYWYKHALSVIPPHLVNRSQSKKIGDILS